MHMARCTKINHLLVLTVFLFIFFTVVSISSAEAEYGPQDHMRCAVEEIMAILQDDRLSQQAHLEERRQLMLAVVQHHFDFMEMSKRSLAQAWKKRSEAEKKDFVDVFSQLLENTYVKRVEAYSEEEVLFLKERVKGKKSIVDTVIRQNDLEIPINYKMLQKDDDWLVYDVIIEGVSLVQNYRTQFRSIIRKEKYAGLVVRLEEKLEKIRAGNK